VKIVWQFIVVFQFAQSGQLKKEKVYHPERGQSPFVSFPYGIHQNRTNQAVFRSVVFFYFFQPRDFFSHPAHGASFQSQNK
jgi:hypothetical protein